jgi:hypothetical protein
MMIMKMAVLLGACILAVVDLVAAEEKPAQADKQAYGFKFLYAEKVAPREYLQQHPCICGSWVFEKETDTHWIGSLSYPTGNVPPAFPTDKEPAFEVKHVKVAKLKNPPIDLKTYKGPLILLQSDASVRFATPKSLDSTFQLVAVEVTQGKAEGFLLQNRKELAYGEKR